jgi:peptidoglycan-associated lipoprotein
MKLTKLTHLVVLAIVLTIAASGCRKRPQNVTPLPGARAGEIQNPGAGEPLPGGAGADDKGAGSRDLSGKEGNKFSDTPGHDGWIQNAEALKSYTVYFDFDRSAVKTSEASKVKSVAEYLQNNKAQAVRVDGHCDERGTEEYNRALGERRALAIRDELIKLGIDGNRVDTMTFGKDKPADPGHDDAAHRKNRRGEFIVLSPPSA